MLAAAAWHVTSAGTTAATASTNYTIEIQNASTSHVTHLAVERRALTGLSNATENPAAFGDNVTPNGTSTRTIAIRAPATVASGQITVDGAGAADIAATTRTTFSSLAASGSGNASTAASTRIALGALAVDGAGGVAIADATVSAGGVSSGPLSVSGASTIETGASTRTTFGSLAVAGASATDITTTKRTTLSSLTADGTGSVAIAAAKRTTFGLAAIGAGCNMDIYVPSEINSGDLQTTTSWYLHRYRIAYARRRR
jgi:hypothetical protein